MARGNRTYKRDANGRFASTGGGGKRSRPAAKRVERGPNKLTRDNSGKITSVGGNGATARGGRLRTALGNLRAFQTTRIAGGRAGMVGKGGKLKGSKVLPTTRLTDNSRLPASQRPGSMTNTLRSVMGSLAKQDAKYIREVEGITGQKVRAPKGSGSTAASNRVKATGAGGSVSQTLRAGLRELAQSDARTMRGMAEIVRDSRPKLSGERGLSARGKVRPAANPKPAALPAATGRRKPLKNVGSALKNNLKGFAGLPVQVRSRKQAAAAQRFRRNELGKKAAASKGFNEAVAKRQTFADSAPRIVVGRKKIKQFTLTGGVKTMGAGRFKEVGTMTGSGRVFKPSKPRPLPNSKSGRKETQRRAAAGDPWAIAALKKQKGN